MKSSNFNRNQFMMTSLDEMISKDSKVRVIDAYVHSLDVEQLGYKIYTNKVGRPSYNPQDLIGLYLYSYMSQVMSSRKMEEQTYINIEIIWLLDGVHPDHSTIAAFRSKNAQALTNTFRNLIRMTPLMVTCKHLNSENLPIKICLSILEILMKHKFQQPIRIQD